MATNKVQDGKILRLTVASTVASGDPIAVGNAVRGVAITSYEAVDGKASIDTEGVFDLSVQAVDDAGNSAVAVGDRLYFAGTATPWLSKKKSGKFFGIALETVTTGATATINVLIGPATGPDRASHQVFAAGINVVNDSPLAAEEFIPVTGILATDVVVCTLSVNTGSPSLYILKAVAAASPAGITVTASGTFTAGDAINYCVLRAAL
jgi:predicted RecA/RadA family phage recombinase